MKLLLPGLLLAFLLVSCSMEKLYTMKQRNKVYAYEQLDFHELMKRYMQKESSPDDFEGIYSVSLVVNKKGGILTDPAKERVVERQENYQEVAIIRDHGNPNRDYIEVPLDKKFLPSYSIRGEFSKVVDANLLIYNRFEPRGKSESYTFTYDASRDMLEGIRKDKSKNAEYTYSLTYIRLSNSSNKSVRK